MEREQIEQTIKNIIAQLVNMGADEIRLADLLDSFGFDENGFRILAKKIKDEFNVTVLPSEIADCQTVNDLVNLIAAKLS